MAKRTKKVGITGRYGTRYGATLRKLVKRIERDQRKAYDCPHCGKACVKRVAAGIWVCKDKGNNCGHVYAGGCWSMKTPAAETVRATIHHLKKGMAAAEEDKQ